LNLTFQRKKVSGLLLVVPANEKIFLDEMKDYNFPESRSLKLKKVMGYDRHRLVEGNVCVSDLAVFGFQYLADHGFLRLEEIDALVLVTQSPDYLMPPTSSVIQGRLGLKRDMYCLDINQGCAGFLIGLMQAFMMLEQDSIHKVALVNADVLSRKTSIKDRNSYPLVGDAAAITVIEKDDRGSKIFANLKMDGSRHDVLMIPAGGMRQPSSPETAMLEDMGDNNFRSKDHLCMRGSEVFNFVQIEVPPMIDDLISFSGVAKDAINYFIFHQPNKFMLQKLADKMKVSHDRMPNNVVEHFGNASSVTIPTALAFNFRDTLTHQSYLMCLAGFGVGLTWSSMLLTLGNMAFCEMIDYK
jgi:3-oxoacyl-[acyl-carrier-protein] synthase-3